MAMVAGGLLLPALVAVYYLFALSVNPFAGAWYLFLLVTGHAVGLVTALLGCVLLGALASALVAARARRDEEGAPPPARPAVYGPGAHAGPGSLGGTESALRR